MGSPTHKKPVAFHRKENVFETHMSDTFNPHLMAIQRSAGPSGTTANRNTETSRSYTTQTHERVKGENATLNTDVHAAQVRTTPSSLSCVSREYWADMGPCYHPRFVRVVECTQSHCYDGHHRCLPRQTGLHVLRKMVGSCTVPNQPAGVIWSRRPISINRFCECAH